MDFFDTISVLVPLFLLLPASILLVVLTVIDLRHFLLPNRYVFPFGILGGLFHLLAGFEFLPPTQILLGGLIGGGLLYAVRYFGTLYYKQEAMGLGDIKLMAAGGIWLGPEHIITAIMIGALAGLMHGLVVAVINCIKHRDKFSIKRLVIPAGPGFIIGLVVVFFLAYGALLQDRVHLFFLWAT